MCLQAGCKWVWSNSGRSGPEDSELSNEYKSAFSSWDSSLDLDVGSWRETEDSDAEAEELKESSPEKESSEFFEEDVQSEEPQEEGEQGNSQNLLHFPSEVMVRLLFPQLERPHFTPFLFPFPFHCLFFSPSLPFTFSFLSFWDQIWLLSPRNPTSAFLGWHLRVSAALAHPTFYQNAYYPCVFLLLLVLFTETKARD